jgi:RNA polymerase sigma factor (TIGR02999 family)
MSSSDRPAEGEVTRLLGELRAGQSDALDRLLPLVHDDLRVIAARLLRHEVPGHTLQPTDLVHEAYLRLAGGPAADPQNRAHFLAIAARAMRHLLVDHARRRNAAKRGGGLSPVRITNEQVGVDLSFDDLLALDDALDRLAALDGRLRQVVECRFFGGLTEPETAEALGVTTRTVQRDWTRARAWLYQQLYPSGA